MNLIDKNTDLTGMDCHMHSRFSPDALRMGAGTPEEIVRTVRERGLRGFIITDHVDIGHWDGHIIDFDEYFRVWENVRKNNPDLTVDIGVVVGFELEYAAETYRVIKDIPFEYVINSVHYWQKKPYDKAWARGKQINYEEYLKLISHSLDADYGISTLGHIGFSERYSPYPPEDRVMDYPSFKPLFDEIIKKAIARGVNIEENTSGNGDMYQPREDFLRAFKAAGGRRPMLGSDAHYSSAIARNFDTAEKFLDGIFR